MEVIAASDAPPPPPGRTNPGIGEIMVTIRMTHAEAEALAKTFGWIGEASFQKLLVTGGVVPKAQIDIAHHFTVLTFHAANNLLHEVG